MGRFISRDPVLGKDGLPLTRNGYIYVLNNPFKYVDPTGMGEQKTLDRLFAEQEMIAAQIRSAEYWLADLLQEVREVNYQEGDWAGKAGGFLVGSIGDAIENLAKANDPNVTGGQRFLAKGGVMLDVGTFGKGSVVKQGVKKGGGYILNETKKKLLEKVSSRSIKNMIESLYKPIEEGTKVIGDGGAIDALKHELLTGELVGGTSHLIKVKETVRALNNLLRSGQLNDVEVSIARELKNKALDVLKGGGNR